MMLVQLPQDDGLIIGLPNYLFQPILIVHKAKPLPISIRKMFIFVKLIYGYSRPIIFCPKAPVIAKKPPTKPPIKPVKRMTLPLEILPNKLPILSDKICALPISK